MVFPGGGFLWCFLRFFRASLFGGGLFLIFSRFGKFSGEGGSAGFSFVFKSIWVFRVWVFFRFFWRRSVLVVFVYISFSIEKRKMENEIPFSIGKCKNEIPFSGKWKMKNKILICQGKWKMKFHSLFSGKWKTENEK